MSRRERKAMWNRELALREEHGYRCECIECHPCGTGKPAPQGTFRVPCLGATCGGCWQSVRCAAKFESHPCSAGSTNALFALVMAMVVGLVVYMAVHGGGL